MKSVDVVIVGGGIVGTVLATGLAERVGLNTVLIDASVSESHTTEKSDFNPFTDTRVIALARRTVNELANLGIDVDDLTKQCQGDTPPEIKHIEVSDKGHLGLVDLYCDDYHISAFGRVVSLSALTQLAANVSNAYECRAPATVTAVAQRKEDVVITLDSGEDIKAKLLILADGGRSTLSSQVGINKAVSEYNQTALVFNLHTQLPHQNKAYERFTSSGPLAFLPYDSEIDGIKASGNGFSVVWTVERTQAVQLMQLDQVTFLQHLQDAFGYRQGQLLRISSMASYPLSLVSTTQVVAHRVAVVGNAAQSLHPIAGQGFNLGLRDICALIEVLIQAKAEAKEQAKIETVNGQFDTGAFSITRAYEARRITDRNKTMLLTDTLVRVFSNGYFPSVVGRNVALLTLALLPNVKRTFVKQTTGYGETHEQQPILHRDNYAAR